MYIQLILRHVSHSNWVFLSERGQNFP